MNEPPKPPIVTSASMAHGRLHLGWQEASAHDVLLYSIHGGGPGFQVDEFNRIGEKTDEGPIRSPDQTASLAVRDPVEYVRVVAIDTGGLRAVSEPMRVGDPARPGADASELVC